VLVLIAILLALIPAVAILYPFIRRPHSPVLDESSAYSDLTRRWDAAVAGLKSAELEHSIGSLADDDYRWLREQYLAEAALIMRDLDLEEQQEREFRASLDNEIQRVRRDAEGEDREKPNDETAGE
jgi:hypothetical protein